METWVFVAVGIGLLLLIDAFSKINKRFDEVIKRQNEIEENILEEVRDCGINQNKDSDFGDA